jgi:hypothetical protein
MKIIQIITDNDKEHTIIGLGDDGRVYVFDRDTGVWKLYADTTYEDSDDIVHEDKFDDNVLIKDF